MVTELEKLANFATLDKSPEKRMKLIRIEINRLSKKHKALWKSFPTKIEPIKSHKIEAIMALTGLTIHDSNCIGC